MTITQQGVRLGEIADQVRRSTVAIRCGRRGAGSGVFWSVPGLVVTNHHVARVDRVEVEVWHGEVFPGDVVARAPGRDLALVQTAAEALAPRWGKSSELRAGELVVAVGNPLGFSGAVSQGVVHGVGAIAGLGRHPWVQASIQLAPGNSGGPLANSRGEIVGVNAMVVSGGLGLAVPSNSVAEFVAGRRSPPRRLGVSVREVRLPGGRLALLLVEVEPKSAADRASLRIGDILTGASETPLRTLHDLADAIERDNPLRIQFLRGADSPQRETVVRWEERKPAAA